ncbi:hypothetical protein [Massilia sp. Bi118]|uniref:hypothetical protein n=1 Tax=Massilia sp. Bi118 TaxID=2822346 RepID=UPI001E5ECFD3|nr:hypothetical protein [Massilia sp. Bi118]
MAILFRMDLAYRTPVSDRRYGLLLTVLVHVALVIGWQAARNLPAPAAQPDGPRTRILWIPLQLPKLRQREPEPEPELQPAAPRREATAPGLHARPALPLPPLPAVTASPAPADSTTPSTAPTANADASPQVAPQKASAAQILQQAKRDIGSIAKALRKENNPYIAAPLDSPVIRMQRGMEQAHALAAPRLWEAPKVEELVNNTGDGARRTRVITGNGTYCVTERATNTDVEMIEHHGKLRLTNCPTHEEPAKQQTWRTLRD